MKIEKTKIDGLTLVHLDIFADERGSFREAWQAEKAEEAGLPKLEPVQFNVSVSNYGTIRGIHAEPWDKYIHVAHGKVFAAIVDLRKESSTFGQYETIELDETKAIFVPKGMGNSFQALSEKVVYAYLVTDIWRGMTNPYPAVAFDDPELAIPWPLPEETWIVSDKDRNNPTLKEAYS